MNIFQDIIKRKLIQFSSIESLCEYIACPVPQDDRLRFTPSSNKLLDINDRPKLDAQVLYALAYTCNGTAFEVGSGSTTYMLADIFERVITVDINPKAIGDVPKNVKRIIIDSSYLQKSKTFIDLQRIDFAFIDGGHTTESLFNDTITALSKSHPGTVILWHDICPELRHVYSWLGQCYEGLNRVLKKTKCFDYVFTVNGSWMAWAVVK